MQLNSMAMAMQTVYRSGIDINERECFGFELDEKAYKVLSSDIYKYKIRAIVREICSNAVDGHMLARNMNPFDVYMPTMLEPRFSVRDYGVGLSDEEIRHHATVYFKSSKTKIKDAIGFLGLGFKSPFCYAETFTIVSWHGGFKRTYVAYKENGKPYVDPIEVVASNEPVGVQIIVPVKVEDIKEWMNEAGRVFESFMTVRPNFVDVPVKVAYQPSEPSNENGLIVYKSKYYSGVYARMGNIMYPIDNDLYENTLLEYYSDSYNTTVFPFELGDLDFMPSREELSLDKVTKANLVSRIAAVNSMYHANLLKGYNECKTIREKVAFAVNQSSTNVENYIKNHQDFFVDDKSIGDFIPNISPRNNEELEYISNLPGFWANSHGQAKRCEYKIVGIYRYHRNETQSRINISKIISPEKQLKLYVVEDDAKIYTPALSGYCILNNLSLVYFVSKPVYDLMKERFDRFVKYCHFDESDIVHLKASEMIEETNAYFAKFPKQEKSQTVSNRRKRPKTPNAIRWTLDKSGVAVNKEELFLTKDEFINLPATNAIRLFGLDEFSPIDDGVHHFNISRLVDNMLLMMHTTGIHSLLQVRNSLWNYIPESNVIDLQKSLLDLLNASWKRLKPNGYSCVANSSTEIVTLQKHYGVTLDRLVKNRYDAVNYPVVKFIVRHLTNQDDYYSEIKNKFYENKKLMQARAKTAYEHFKASNPMLACIIECVNTATHASRYLTQRPGKQDFINLIRWK